MSKMVDLEMLKTVMLRKTVSVKELEEKTGIQYSRLESLLDGEREMQASDIYKIAQALNLTEKEKSDIFFPTC